MKNISKLLPLFMLIYSCGNHSDIEQFRSLESSNLGKVEFQCLPYNKGQSIALSEQDIKTLCEIFKQANELPSDQRFYALQSFQGDLFDLNNNLIYTIYFRKTEDNIVAVIYKHNGMFNPFIGNLESDKFDFLLQKFMPCSNIDRYNN